MYSLILIGYSSVNAYSLNFSWYLSLKTNSLIFISSLIVRLSLCSIFFYSLFICWAVTPLSRLGESWEPQTCLTQPVCVVFHICFPSLFVYKSNCYFSHLKCITFVTFGLFIANYAICVMLFV